MNSAVSSIRDTWIWLKFARETGSQPPPPPPSPFAVHLQLSIIFQISHCLLQACLAQLNVSNGIEYLADCPLCRFMIKLNFLLMFSLQVFKNFAEKTDFVTWTMNTMMNSDHARESHYAVASSVCLYSYKWQASANHNARCNSVIV